MNNQNSVDWLAVQTQAPDKTFSDIYSQGVTPDNVTMQDASFYRDSPVIQSKFKKPDGSFDTAAFNNFYLEGQKSLNAFQKSNFDLGNVTTDLWEDTSVARALNAPIRKNPVKISMANDDPFTRLKNAEGSFFGLSEINKWTSPTKSISEVAQAQKVLDGKTGKSLDYTPNDTGLTNLFGFFSDPLVLSSYDDDVKDAQGKIIHKKGEMKLDENGMPRYETLAGRDPGGKQQLSRWDTLTTDGSFFNKFDYMDSDGIDKSITGTIVKGATEAGMLFLGGEVGAAYKAYYIASGLLDSLAQIGKSVDGIINNSDQDSFYKFANQLQGYLGNTKTGMSESGKSSMFSTENLMNQVVDALFMMKSQNTVAQWPTEIKKYQMARELGLVEGNAAKAIKWTADESGAIGGKLFDFNTYTAKYGSDLESAVKAIQSNQQTLEKYGKYSHYMSTAYMAASMAPSISAIADKQGIDARDKGWLYLGYASALMPFFNAGIAKWVEGGLEVDELAKGIHAATEDWAAKSLPKAIVDNTEKLAENTFKGRSLAMLASGRGMGKAIVDRFKNFTVHNLATAAIGGGVEMASLEGLKTGIESIYNSLNKAGYTSSLEDKRFDLNADEVLREIGGAAFGGAFGGAIFKLMDQQKHDVFKSSNMMEYVVNGYATQVIDKINALKEKGQLGSTKLSMQPLRDINGNNIDGMWQPVGPSAPVSQNDFLAQNMIKQVKIQEAIRRAADVLDPNATADKKSDYFAGIVDARTDTDLRTRIYNSANRIFELSTELGTVPQDDEHKEALNMKRAELTLEKKNLEYLQSDESLDEFFRQGLFNLRGDIHAAFGVQTRESMAKDINPNIKSYAALSAEEKQAVDNRYNEYKNTDGVGGLQSDLYNARLSYDRFNTNMERKGHYNRLDLYKQSLEALKGYRELNMTEYKDDEGKLVSGLVTIELADDYINKLKGVEYIPDFMYDKIKEELVSFQSSEADKHLSNLTPNPDSLVHSITQNIDSIDLALNDEYVKKYIAKKLGDKQFEELVNSPELKDLQENKDSASHYSLLSTLHKLSLHNDDARSDAYRNAANEMYSRTDDEIAQVIAEMVTPTGELEHSKVLIDYLSKLAIPELLESFGDALYDLHDNLDDRTLLANILLLAHMKDVTKEDVDPSEAIGLLEHPYFGDNFMVGLLADGRYTTAGNVLYTNSIRNNNIEALEMNVAMAKDFEATRVKSPIADILKETYEFTNAELKTLDEVGYSNYLNRNASFSDALKWHMDAVKRVAALIESAASLNPLVNDFRKNNPATLDNTKKGLTLFVISPDDTSHLDSELGKLYSQLQHLDRINTYNKNNTLARLLREDGLDLASKYIVLKDIASRADVVDKLPSLATLFELDDLGTYANAPKTSSDELKKQALYQVAQLEHNVYLDFQKLNESDKQKIANSTFLPVDVDTLAFYNSGDTQSPYNDYARTIYLARTYGASSMDFYEKFAGKFDSATELFENIEKSKYMPFPNQEGAIRMAHLFQYGDRSVIQKLFNAYATPWNEKGEYDFSDASIDSVATYSAFALWGDPGTGKTTASFNSMVTLMPEGGIGDLLLLAPKQRQVDGLKQIVTDAGYESRIDQANSRIFRDFLKSMGLRTSKNDAIYDLSKNDEAINYPGLRGDEITTKFREQLMGDKGIIKQLDIYKDSSDSGYTLKDSITKVLSKYKLIAIDEYTHANPMDLAMLIKLVDLYNGSNAVKGAPSKRITVTLLGDPNQLGYVGADGAGRNYTDINRIVVTSPLTTSLRSGWDVVNNTQRELINRAVKYNLMSNKDIGSSDTIAESKQTPIKLNYTEGGENGNLGIKMVNTKEDLTTADLAFITDNKNLIKGKDILYVVENEGDIPKAQALLQDTLGDNWSNFADIYTPNEVQGGERKYAIIAAGAKMVDESDESLDPRYNIRKAHKFLNTMLSRATEATLFKNDGRYDKFITFQNEKQNKAIRQIKLDDNIKNEIKRNKQSLMKVILQSSSATPVEKAGEQPSEEFKATQALAVNKATAVEPLFTSVPVERQVYTAKDSDVISYNSYMTIADRDAVFKLRYPDMLISEVNNYTKEVSQVVNSYKYYLLHKDLIGDRQIALRSNFKNVFEDANLDWENPEFYFEAGKRGKGGLNVGRTELTNQDPKRNEDEYVFSLKVKLPFIDDTGARVSEKDLSLNMGFVNNLDSLTAKLPNSKDSDAIEAHSFLSKLKAYINTGKVALTTGEHSKDESGFKWTSPALDALTFAKYSEIFTSRLHLGGKESVGLGDLQEEYFDFYITSPQVVVAALNEANDNSSVLNPSGNNKDYEEYWKVLKGKAISFLTDVYELRNTLTPKDMLDTYIKQLGYFGPDGSNEKGERWSEMTNNDQKKQYIDNIETAIPVGTSGATIPFRPFQIKMLKLDNPTMSFLGFREKFLDVVNRKTMGVKLTPDQLEEFNTSIYVKDRIAKSLITLQKFLETSDGMKYFESKILPKQHTTANDIINEIEEQFKDYNAHISDIDYAKIGPIGAKAFKQQLDDLLTPEGEDSIFRGTYPTIPHPKTGADSNRKVYKANLEPGVSGTDLNFKLTGDKLADFAGSLIDLKLFNLFKRTRNPNFAHVIDLSLRALGGFDKVQQFKNYDLSKIFKDGKIETVVVAQSDNNADHTTNVIAEVVQHGNDFQVNLDKLAHPSYNIHFADVIKDWLGKAKAPEAVIEAPEDNGIADYIKQFNDLKGTSVYEEHMRDLSKYGTLDELKEALSKIPEVKAQIKGELHLNTVESYQLNVADPSLTGHRTIGDVLLDTLNEKFPLANDQHYTLSEQSSSKKSLVVRASDGTNTYDLSYDASKGIATITPIVIKQTETSSPMDVLKKLEQEEMASYDEVSGSLFKDAPTELKPLLDLLRDDFRYTMITSNIASVVTDKPFKLGEYDSELAQYNTQTASVARKDFIAANRGMLFEHGENIIAMNEYTDKYTPKLC